MTLSTSQLAHLGARLREERTRVMSILRRYNAELDDTQQDADGDLSKMPYHPADEGTDTFDRELDAQELTRVTEELHEIDAALERLYHDPDSFGVDAHSGEEIPFARLDVIPWARTVVAPSEP